MERGKMINSMQQNLKVNYKTAYDGISCITVFDGFGQLINQINNDDADYIYNSLVGNPKKCLKELREENRKLFKDALKAHKRYDPIISKTETDDSIIINTEMGTITYLKIKLAIFWLTHSNDCFYETFGFNWVPSSKLQDLARKKINESMNSDIKFIKAETKQAEVKLEIPKKIDLDNLKSIQSLAQFENEMRKTGFGPW